MALPQAQVVEPNSIHRIIQARNGSYKRSLGHEVAKVYSEHLSGEPKSKAKCFVEEKISFARFNFF